MEKKFKDYRNKTSPGRRIHEERHTVSHYTDIQGGKTFNMICWEWSLWVTSMNRNQQSLTPQSWVYHVWSLLVSLKSAGWSHHGTTAGAGLCSIPWLLTAPRLIFLTPSLSCSYADLLATHNWKCRFDTGLVFHTCCRRKNPAPFFHVPVFISSFPFFGPNPLCSIAVGQSEPGSALKHWQAHGFKHAPPAWCSSSHRNLITSHWNQLPKKHQILLMLTFSNTRVPASKTEHNSFQYSKKPCK